MWNDGKASDRPDAASFLTGGGLLLNSGWSAGVYTSANCPKGRPTISTWIGRFDDCAATVKAASVCVGLDGSEILVQI